MDRQAVIAALERRVIRTLASECRRMRPDAAAWALIAWSGSPAVHQNLEHASARLQACQQPDGRIVMSPDFPEAAWPTPLSILGWLQQSNPPPAADRAVDFLLHWQGKRLKPEPKILGHDTTLAGWPWISQTHSWIEPTTSALLALQRAGRAAEPRCVEGRELIMNRQLSAGGWNYGNTTVFGRELRPMIHTTGMALAAMRSHAGRSEVEGSIRFLRENIESVRAPLSLAWGLTGLAAWDERPSQADQWLCESLLLEPEYGTYDFFLLCLVHAALQPADKNPLLPRSSV